MGGKSLSRNKTLLIGGVVGFALFTLTSHKKSRVHKKIKPRKYRNVSLTPNIKLHRRKGYYHLHHWLVLASMYAPLALVNKKTVRSRFLQGMMLGGIIQGLSYEDRFKIVHALEEAIEAGEKNLPPTAL